MERIKNFESFVIDTSFDLIDNLKESLSMWHDMLLASMGAQEVNIEEEFDISSEVSKLDIDNMVENSDFLKALSSIGLKSSPVEETDDYETFINKPCRFMLIYRLGSIELETPEYILFQSWDDSRKDWTQTELYRIEGNINEFYDKLTSRTIEIVDGETNYIYNTSNGNDWILQNPQNQNDVYLKNFRKEEFEELINKKGLKLNII